MKKNIILTAAALSLCCACTKETDSVTNDGGQYLISINPNVIVTTRAAIDGTAFPADGTIVLSAYHNAEEGTSANYFSGIAFAKSGDVWTASKYWPYDGTLDLLGYYTGGLTPTDTTYDAKAGDGVTLAMPDNSSVQADILHAAAQAQSYSASGTAMVFRHAQALVTFNAVCSTGYDAAENTGITITKITLNDARYSGTLAIKAQPTEGSYCTWSSLADQKDVDLPGISTYDVGSTLSTLSMGIGDAGLMVPEQAQTSFTVHYTLHNGKNGETALDNDLQYTYTCTGDWTEGKKYNYQLTFGLDQITVSPTVTDWVVSNETPNIPEVVSASYAVNGLTSVTMPAAAMAGNTEVMVKWGDGESEAFTNATKGAVISGDNVTMSHTYASAFTGSVRLYVRSGSLNFGKLESTEYAKFTVSDATKVIVETE